MNILHIIQDEKFIDAAYRSFEEASPGNNRFVILSKAHQLKYIKNTPVQFVEFHAFMQKSFIASLKNYEMVIIHGMDNNKMQLLARADNKIKLVWIGWGYDYYDLITDDINKLLLPKTLSIWNGGDFNEKHSLLIKIKIFIKSMIYKNINKVRFVNRVNFFAPVLYEDYELVQLALPAFKPQYLSWNYGNLDNDLINGYENATISGDNILVGNSATNTNNHLDVFDKLATIDLADRKLLCPLSYGNTTYRDIIISEGLKQFGSNFVPIKDFMPIQEYVNQLSTCSMVLMGHLRQQGSGNIVIMMYLGAKVFLNSENPIYKFFKKEGALIFSQDELASEYTTRLDPASVKHNRNVLRRHWCREVMFSKTKKLIETVLAHPI